MKHHAIFLAVACVLSCGLLVAKGDPLSAAPTTGAVNSAVKSGNWVVVKRYIESGGDVTACLHPSGPTGDKPHCPTLLDYLYRYGKTDLVILAVKEGAYAGKAQLGLDAAASNNMPKLVQLFLRKGAKVNPDISKGEVDSPPLVAAVVFNSLAAAQILVAAGADVNYQDDMGWTPLGESLNDGREEMADLLVRNGAKLNMRSNQNMTLMEAAAGGKLPKYISILAQLGFNVNIVDTNGDTPLLAAVSSYPPRRKDMALETVKTLLRWGADPCYRDKAGKTARDYAIQSRLPKVVAFLYQYKAQCASKTTPTSPASTVR